MKWDREEERYMSILNWSSWAWIRWLLKSTINPNHNLVFEVSSWEGWCCCPLGFRELFVCDQSLKECLGCSLWERVEGPCHKMCHHHPRLERCPLRLFFWIIYLLHLPPPLQSTVCADASGLFLKDQIVQLSCSRVCMAPWYLENNAPSPWRSLQGACS